ncbi:hypothetical protein BX600DRAFT_518225 [Xylariales sp. PMI_506]|nr:hypothetical protein BX600DRAFT_518225 [Xylariales sp. PMI_506]
MPSTEKKSTCKNCGQSFSRPSHLKRHSETHTPLGRRAVAFPCAQCHRSFSRNDVLLRHMRNAHRLVPEARLGPGGAQKSCNRCVEKKSRCDRAQPCKTCALVGARCFYPRDIPPTVEHIERRDETLSPLSTRDQYGNDEPNEYSRILPLASFTFAESAGRDRTTSLAGVLASGIGSKPNELVSPPEKRAEPIVPPADNYAAIYYPTSGSPASYTTVPSVSDAPVYDRAASTSFTSGLLEPAAYLSFGAGSFDWLDFDVPELALADVNMLTPVTQVASLPAWDALPLPPEHPQQAPQPLQPWPFDQARDPLPHQYRLPPLRLVLEGTPDAASCVPAGLIHLLSEPRLPSPDETLYIDLLPAINTLKPLIDEYFKRFHAIQPVTHLATWSISSCPTVLLAAMACVGALLSEDGGAVKLSTSLGKLCVLVITWLGASDSACYQDVSFLNALCLHQIHSLGSGSRELYQNADRSRGVLMGSLRGMGIFNAPLGAELNLHDATMLMTADPGVIHSQWMAWVSRERERRVAWAAFEYDCSLCTLTSRRGAVDLSELPRDLPCSESLWEAPSASAWAALRSRLGVHAVSTTFSSVVATALAGQPIPTHVSSWGKRLCAQVIGRILWDLKQFEIMAARDWFGLPSLYTAQQKPKGSLLCALDNLLQSMQMPVSTADLISYNISSLLCHYSHLYTSGDIMDSILFIVRNVVSKSAHDDGSIEMAEGRLRSSFVQNPRKARELVWHAAQIVAMAREYLVSAPCEILRLFMGYVYIIAFSRYFPSAALDSDGRRRISSVTLRLDVHEPTQTRAVKEWIARGGIASIGSAEDVCAEGSAHAIGRDAQRMLQRLRCWGLADKFIKILQSLESQLLARPLTP